MNPLAIAAKGKGPLKMIERAGAISSRYGLTSSKMDRVLAHFTAILKQHDCRATFPITAAALARSRGIVEKYQAHNIEFSVHGYYHIDHSRLSLDEQVTYLSRARRLFEERGITCNGFRCPYLRWGQSTIAAVSQCGFGYDSSQALAWDVVKGIETESYERVLGFYGAVSAAQYPALPRWDNGLVRIPYCLPDDEALIDRFQLKAAEPMSRLWLDMLARIYQLGELFTLALHPERIYLCQASLIETLRHARTLAPQVWFARLDEIARWWRARRESAVTITDSDDGELHLSVRGPAGVTLLARGVEIEAPTTNWDGVYRRLGATECRMRVGRRPFIGVSSTSAQYLTSFLQQQGYIVEQTDDPAAHPFYLHRPVFGYEDERPLLAQIEGGAFPLVRMGRWPYGARSALCVTGDIDALTIWDYALRLLEASRTTER
jgi:peptidoglycan/xylan/chitin deacetylase (PgdA/CDA1 family)